MAFSIDAMHLKSQLRWIEFVCMLENHRILKIILGELAFVHLDNAALEKDMKNGLENLSVCHIDHCQWLALPGDRVLLGHVVHLSPFDVVLRSALNRSVGCQEKS